MDPSLLPPIAPLDSQDPSPLAATKLHSKLNSAGFSLMEVVFAISIFAGTLVVMLGLLAVGLKTARKATHQTLAANIIATLAADLRASAVVDTPDPTTGLHSYKFTSPFHKIIATYNESTQTVTVEPSSLLLSDVSTMETGSGSSGMMRIFRVALTPPAQNSKSIQVRVSWPYNTPVDVQPEGFVESMLTLPVP